MRVWIHDQYTEGNGSIVKISAVTLIHFLKPKWLERLEAKKFTSPHLNNYSHTIQKNINASMQHVSNCQSLASFNLEIIQIKIKVPQGPFCL